MFPPAVYTTPTLNHFPYPSCPFSQPQSISQRWRHARRLQRLPFFGIPFSSPLGVTCVNVVMCMYISVYDLPWALSPSPMPQVQVATPHPLCGWRDEHRAEEKRWGGLQADRVKRIPPTSTTRRGILGEKKNVRY